MKVVEEWRQSFHVSVIINIIIMSEPACMSGKASTIALLFWDWAWGHVTWSGCDTNITFSIYIFGVLAERVDKHWTLSFDKPSIFALRHISMMQCHGFAINIDWRHLPSNFDPDYWSMLLSPSGRSTVQKGQKAQFKEKQGGPCLQNSLWGFGRPCLGHLPTLNFFHRHKALLP